MGAAGDGPGVAADVDGRAGGGASAAVDGGRPPDREQPDDDRWPGRRSPADHVTVVLNPAAGRGRAVRVAEQARSVLAAAGLPVRVLRTGVRAGAALPVQLGDPGRAVIVCGGDGTVAAALPSLVTLAGTGRPVPLGVLPAGTGNDFAGELGVPGDPGAALAAIRADLAAGRSRPVDIGWVRPGLVAPATAPVDAAGAAVPGVGATSAAGADGAMAMPSTGAAGRPFATVVACGFDSRVTARRNRSRLPLGPLAYPAAVLAELATFRPAAYRVTVDGTTSEFDAVLVAVGNTATYGGGLRICPDARPDDGLLEVTVVRAVSRTTLVRVFPRVYSGGHRAHPAVVMLRGRVVTVQELAAPATGSAGTSVVPVHADGEPVVPVPVTCSVRPGLLPVLGCLRPTPDSAA